MELLKQLKEIVVEEIGISKKLLPISERDNRIGYHSEAHGYKIFPEKLKWRISEMEKLLETEFAEVEERLKNGELPLPFYYGKEDGARVYNVTETDIEAAKWLGFIDADGRETYTLTFGMKELEMQAGDPFRLMIKRSGKRNDAFAPDGRIFTRLVAGRFSTDAFGFFIPKND